MLATVFGTITLILWSVQLIPQIHHTYKRKSTKGLSLGLLGTWLFAGTFQSVYVLFKMISLPLIIQPHLFTFFCIICLLQDIYYYGNDCDAEYNGSIGEYIRNKVLQQRSGLIEEPVVIKEDNKEQGPSDIIIVHSNIQKTNSGERKVGFDIQPETATAARLQPSPLKPTITLALILFSTWATLEIGIFFALDYAQSDIFSLSIALLSQIFTIAAFIPQYMAIFKLKSCRSLSLQFVILDLVGAVFGVASLAVADRGEGELFDYATASIYFSGFLGDFFLVVLKVFVYRN